MKTRIWKGNSNFSLDKSFVISTVPHSSPCNNAPCSSPTSYPINIPVLAIWWLQLRAPTLSFKWPSPPFVWMLLVLFAKCNHLFESAVSFFLPSDPVAKHRIMIMIILELEVQWMANVSVVGGSQSGTKPSIDKIGAALRYHKKKEYIQLIDNQKLELK